MAPVAQAFEQLWPQARLTNLLDDSLSPDLAAAGRITEALTARMVGLARYVRDQGADGILYTCSAFGPAIEAAAADVGIPTLKPNEAMFEEALALCARAGVDARAGLVTTFAPAAGPMRAEFEEMALLHAQPACLDSACADGAMGLLQAGQPQAHDQRVAEGPMVMMIPSTSRFRTAREVMDFARQNPEKINYGSGGVGSTPHLTTELLGTVTGAKFTHVPYKGGGESIKALMAGEIDLLIDSITSTTAPIASGRVRPVAVGLPKRLPQWPDVPTFEEAGIQKFSMTHWVGIVAPARTPADVQATLHAQVLKALKSPDVVQKFQEIGATPVGNSAADFQRFIAEDLKRWPVTVKAANIQPQ